MNNVARGTPDSEYFWPRPAANSRPLFTQNAGASHSDKAGKAGRLIGGSCNFVDMGSTLQFIEKSCRFVSVNLVGESDAGAVIAAHEAHGRPVIPVAIKCDVPPQVGDDLDLVLRVQLEVNPAEVVQGGKKNGCYGQIDLLEPEYVNIPGDQRNHVILRGSLTILGC